MNAGYRSNLVWHLRGREGIIILGKILTSH